MSCTYPHIDLTTDEVKAYRMQLYHSTGPGYVIFPGFLHERYVAHVVDFWTEVLDPTKTHKLFPGKQAISSSSPNYYLSNPDYAVYRNFFWNKPADEVLHAANFKVQQLRNALEGKPTYSEMYPYSGRACVPRLVVTRNGHDVEAHKDWVGPEPENFQPARLQATLMLSKKGQDYEGEGFVFQTNQGERISFDTDVAINPGDLIIWRYNNEHSVTGITAQGNQKGFIRVLYPPEAIKQGGVGHVPLKIRVRNSYVGRKYLVPLAKKLHKA
jgi:hypothetical protein